MKITSAHFEMSAPDLKSCPEWGLPEFALIGRSNVGKSSLINLLAGRHALAKVSVTPGKTQLINFFVMNGTWSLVDLPGYGFAHVSRQDRKNFNQAVGDYLERRRNIFLVFVLIDSRLPPQKIDLEFLQWLVDGGTPFALIFTKVDKVSAHELAKNVAAFQRRLAEWCDGSPPMLACSAKTKAGGADILGAIESILAQNNRTA
jgi:GTP-binding protein